MTVAVPLGSLRGQLLRWLLIPLLALVALDAVSVYRNALEIADLAYDRSLLASTRALAERVSIVGGKVVANVPYVALDSFETDTLGRLYYKVTGIDGQFVSGYDDLPPLPPDVPRSDAYPALVRFYHANYHAQPVRIAALYQPVYDDSMRGIALIQVGETLDARQGLTRKILFDTLWRQAVLVIVAALLVWFAVRFALRPLMQLKSAVAARAPTDLDDLDPALVHKELRPLVLAMNGYMGRLHALISSQARFIADASHQLRTPLTVLKTQVELAQRTQREAERGGAGNRALGELLAGMAGTTDAAVRLANRLLTLAQSEHGQAEGQCRPVALAELARQAALEQAPVAVQAGIDLALEADGAPLASGNPLLLHELIANLLDNALRYTPAGGRVTLRVGGGAGGPWLEVEDSGCGIGAAERERIFEPFYRAGGAQQLNPDGVGLGLAIVRDIALQHGAHILVADGEQGRGLRLRVQFPPV